MDSRTKMEKVRAMAEDTRCHPRMREIAQSILDRMGSNTELAFNPTPAEAYRRYTEAYAGVMQVKVGPITLPVRFKPQSVCNDKQMKMIFKHCADWPSILTAMRQCVGCIGNETPFGSAW